MAEGAYQGLPADFMARPVDPHDAALDAYLIASMGCLPRETAGALLLDHRHHLIAEERLPCSDPCERSRCLRMLFRCALERDATALIFVHGRGELDPDPCVADLAAARRLEETGRTLDIEILDLVIVTATRSCHLLARGKVDPMIARAGPAKPPAGAAGWGDDMVSSVQGALENAQAAARRQKFRQQMFGAPRLSGGPAWDMLVDLFIHACEGKRVPMSALCIASSMPTSSALRLVHRLRDKQVLELVPDPSDGRRHFVELTRDMQLRLQDYFSTGRSQMYPDLS